MRKALLILVLPFIWSSIFAQIPVSKTEIDLPLQKLLYQKEKHQKVNVLISLQKGQKLFENENVKINSRLGSVATAEISLEALPQLMQNFAIESIEYCGLESPTMDSAKYHTFTYGVHKGWGGIDRAYQGEGIIIGIVDSGIDFDHLEFRDGEDDSKSRIHSVWCQWDSTGTKPDSFSYGSIYTKSQIEDEINGITQETIPNTDHDPTNRGALGHGTHVAGISAGINGMAPKAEIIAVSTLWSSASIIDGIKYIIDEAIKANKPCVVNLSLGSMFDLHDGNGARARSYEALANYRPEGSIICAAAGNSGSSFVHWGNFSTDTMTSVYVYGDPLTLVMAIPDSMLDSIRFRVTGYNGVYDYKKDSFDSLEFYRASKWITPGKIEEDSFYEELFYKGMFEVGSVVEAKVRKLQAGSEHRMFILQIDDKADIDLRQDPPKANGLDLFRIDVEGSTTFNSWLMAVSYTYSGSLARFAKNPEALGAPSVDRYQKPDNDFTIISPAVYKETFAVGSYVNLWQYYDVLGQRQPPRWARKASGSLSTFSSKGPSVDGRTLPEITAPGQNVISAIPDYYSGWSPKVKDGTYAVSSGTSMSTPVVAGAVALYLEQNPNATLADVRDAFLNNTHEDEHTNSNGSLPNNYWGYGKLDVYRVMSGGIFFSQEELNSSGINIYPNPTSNILIIEDEIVDATILSIDGKELIKSQSNQIDVSNLTSGTYLIRIEQEEQIVNSRFVVNR